MPLSSSMLLSVGALPDALSVVLFSVLVLDAKGTPFFNCIFSKTLLYVLILSKVITLNLYFPLMLSVYPNL